MNTHTHKHTHRHTHMHTQTHTPTYTYTHREIKLSMAAKQFVQKTIADNKVVVFR